VSRPRAAAKPRPNPGGGLARVAKNQPWKGDAGRGRLGLRARVRRRELNLGEGWRRAAGVARINLGRGNASPWPPAKHRELKDGERLALGPPAKHRELNLGRGLGGGLGRAAKINLGRLHEGALSRVGRCRELVAAD
jgi:hypothetical protein